MQKFQHLQTQASIQIYAHSYLQKYSIFKRRDRERERGVATGDAKMMLQCVFGGSISIHDMEIERRPYHRYCNCALHNLKDGSPNSCSHQRNISFPKKQSQAKCSLSIAASKSSSHSSLLGELSNRNGEDTNVDKFVRGLIQLNQKNELGMRSYFIYGKVNGCPKDSGLEKKFRNFLWKNKKAIDFFDFFFFNF